MLEVTDLTMAYGPIEVVHNFSFTVNEGEIVTILGRNGAGKTTTLNGVAGVLRAKSGDVKLNGKSITKRRINDIAGRGLAYVPEGRGVFPTLTVFENIACAAYGQGMRRKSAVAEIKRAIEFFPALEPRLQQRAGTMSGGEQQMLVLARAIVTRPQLLLVDEPGLGLSPTMVGQVYQHLVRFNRDDGMAILLVEQYVDLAVNTAARAYVLNKGSVAHEGDCADIRQSRELVSAYIG